MEDENMLKIEAVATTWFTCNLTDEEEKKVVDYIKENPDEFEFMGDLRMKKAELILANFDARIPKIEIKPKNTASKVIISSKMYDDETGEKISVKILFDEVAAIDFRINLFDCMIGAEAFGLFCIKDKEFIESITRTIFDRRKEVFLLEGDYNYDANDEHDMLNCFDLLGEFSKSIDEYTAYVQNVEAGVYIIVAKNVRIER